MNKLTIKQEKFCLKSHELGNDAKAYREVYAAENMSVAAISIEVNRLLKNPKIALRIQELKDNAEKRHVITVDDLIKELEEARVAAMGAETVQASAATGATMAKAKLLGLVTDKQQLSGDKDNPIQHTGEVKLTLNVVSPKTNGSTTQRH